MPSAPALRVEVRASPSLLLALLAMTALALLALALAELPMSLRVILALSAVVAAASSVRHLLRPPFRAFELDGERTRIWRDEEHVPARLRHARVLGPLLVVGLAWEGGPRPHSTTLWLLPDSLDAASHRALRMRLSARTDNP